MPIKVYDYRGRETEPTSSTVMFVRMLDYKALEAEVQKLRTEQDALRAQHEESRQAHHRLIQHTNETEQYLDNAAELLGEIVQSGQAYRECTDKSSATGQRVAVVCDYVAQFHPEPHG